MAPVVIRFQATPITNPMSTISAAAGSAMTSDSDLFGNQFISTTYFNYFTKR